MRYIAVNVAAAEGDIEGVHVPRRSLAPAQQRGPGIGVRGFGLAVERRRGHRPDKEPNSCGAARRFIVRIGILEAGRRDGRVLEMVEEHRVRERPG